MLPVHQSLLLWIGMLSMMHRIMISLMATICQVCWANPSPNKVLAKTQPIFPWRTEDWQRNFEGIPGILQVHIKWFFSRMKRQYHFHFFHYNSTNRTHCLFGSKLEHNNNYFLSRCSQPKQGRSTGVTITGSTFSAPGLGLIRPPLCPKTANTIFPSGLRLAEWRTYLWGFR